MEKTYTVTFVSDYFTLISTHVQASSEDDAIEVATKMLDDYYSWDIRYFSFDIVVELVED